MLCAGFLLGCASTSTSTTSSPVGDRVGNLVLRNVPEVPRELQQDLLRYGNTRSARLHGWLGDSILLGTRFGQTSQLHRVDSPLGTRQQITFGNEPIIAAAPSPLGNRIAYLRDVGGAEFYQVFTTAANGSNPVLLSDGESRYGSLVWSDDGLALAASVSAADGSRFGIEVFTPDGRRETIFERSAGAFGPYAFSPDGTRLLIGQYLSINQGSLLEIDLASGAVRTIIELDRAAAVRGALYAPDGESVLVTTDIGREFVGLYRIDLDDGELTLLSEGIDWDVEQFAVADGAIVFAVNAGGVSTVHARQLDNGALIALPELPTGVVRALFASSNGRVALSINAATHPEDVYELDLDARSITRWTQSETGGLDPASFVAPTIEATDSFDGLEVPMLVYRPANAGSKPLPVLVSIHGGPESQSRAWFSPTTQFLASELGVAVVVPNVRGSRGYGKSYLKLDNGVLREDSVRDIGAVLDWIDAQDDLDSDRVAVSGGSYGGYMVLASMIRYGDRLVAGVERVGISNFVTFLENTKAYRRDLRRAEYGDERDPDMRDFLQAISPLTRADEIRDPLLIVQGYNDPRVPYTESEQIYQALIDSDVPVWFLMAMDEGHGFRKKRNRDVQNAVTMLFLKRYLIGDSS